MSRRARGSSLNRREFFTAGAVTAAGLMGENSSEAGTGEVRHGAPPSNRDVHSNLTIRDYLVREARSATNRALSEYRNGADWKRLIGEKRRQYREMMGVESLMHSARGPVPVHVTGEVDRQAYRIVKLHYESLPDLHVTANLYLPKKPLAARAPAVLYVCGHSQNQKVAYQAHPRRWADLGFVCLIVETIELGEAKGNHHGPYRDGCFHWYSKGYSPAAMEMWNGIRGLDLLASRPEVDPERMGVTGISGGGASTWWIAAGDERIKAAAPVCGTATLEAHIYDRVIDGHCDCMWWTNTYGWDLADVGGLIAPRPMMIASADHDGIFPMGSIRRVYSQLAGLYGKLGKSEHLRLVETPGGHSYHETSRTEIFSWFLKHLAGKDVSPGLVGDLDETPGHQESFETLRVYVNGEPKPNRTLTCQDDFIPVAEPPKIASGADLEKERARLIAVLREQTFHGFPIKPPALEVREEYSLDGDSGSRFAFTSEEGFRLHGKLMAPKGDPRPAVVVLRGSGEDRNGGEELAGRVRAQWAKVIVDVRGTGETAWGDELNWHFRRAAVWTGRTLASMRVWDTLRALQAARQLPRVDGKQVSICARGEMAAVALYAALLDGNVQTVFLESPPATQNAASQKDGRGPAIEMLNCLRFTDLAQVAGLLFPAEVVVAGDAPETYSWAGDLYRSLGQAGKFKKLGSLSEWKPS